MPLTTKYGRQKLTEKHEFFLLAGEIDESIIMDRDLDMSSIRNEHIQQAGGHSWTQKHHQSTGYNWY